MYFDTIKHIKFGIKATSSSEILDDRALAKLSFNFRKSLKPPIFVRNPRWASPTRARPIYNQGKPTFYIHLSM